MTTVKRACGFVIFRKSNGVIEYLLMQATKKSQHWTPPKGHVEFGESDMETALRETFEESGYTKEDLRIVEDARFESTYPVKNKQKIVVYWLAELANTNKEVTLSKEHQNYKWLPIEEACTLAAYQEMQDVLKYFDGYISKKCEN